MTTATTGIADEATIRARLDEAQAVYPLPPLARVSLIVDRAAAWVGELPERTLAYLAAQPPLATLYTDVAGVYAWADHLGFTPHTYVEQIDDGRIVRKTTAGGNWLGWRAQIWHMRVEGTLSVDIPRPLNIVRRAHTGVI